MTRYLVDTSVLSALAPGKPAPETAIIQWVERHEQRLFLSVITVAEIEQGVCKLRRAGGAARAAKLADWLNITITTFGDRIVPVDAAVARITGAMSDAAIAKGNHPGLADILIAATAQAHGATILTRNGKHFAALGAAFIDPFEKLPE